MNTQFDFTYRKYTELLDCLLYNGYLFQSFEEFINRPTEKVVILRHDVDHFPLHSLVTAKLENNRRIKGTYYFRIVKQSFNPVIIKEISDLGHEVGYHYEDVSSVTKRQKIKVKRQKLIAQGTELRAQGKEEISNEYIASSNGNKDYEKYLAELAFESFKKNLGKIRELAPVNTICMHGSPMSRWDSRILWKYYNYREFGIIGEPYFDIDFEKVLYLTDTGRKWNGDKSSVRDKVSQENFLELKNRLKISDNIIAAASANELPNQLMMTVHPQRWSDNLFNWMTEYAAQTLKNRIKQLIFVR